jgi:hypothetical protein
MKFKSLWWFIAEDNDIKLRWFSQKKLGKGIRYILDEK